MASASKEFEPFVIEIEDTMTVPSPAILNYMLFLDGYITAIATMSVPCPNVCKYAGS
jgi:hypothetical protein